MKWILSMIMCAAHMSTKRPGTGRGRSGPIRAAALWKQCLSEWNGLPEDEFQMIYDDKDDEFDEEYIITIPK